MLDLKMAILDRFSRNDLETALIRRSYRELGLIDRTFHDGIYNTGNIKWHIKEKHLEALFKRSYEEVMDSISIHVQGECDENKLMLIKSFRKIVTLDLAYSYLGQVVDREERVYPGLYFPKHFFAEDGSEKDLRYSRAPVDIRGKVVIETPYNTHKWIEHIKRSDDLDAEKYEAGVPSYYPELNVLVQGAGSIHRTAESFLNQRDGTAMAHIYEDEELYNHLKTDGYSWFNSHTGEKIDGYHINDYRFAVIFSLRQMERDLESPK